MLTNDSIVDADDFEDEDEDDEEADEDLRTAKFFAVSEAGNIWTDKVADNNSNKVLTPSSLMMLSSHAIDFELIAIRRAVTVRAEGSVLSVEI